MADYSGGQGFSFPGPVPQEALDYFRAKGFTVGFHHLDVWAEEHAAAFTVAKAMQDDILIAIRVEVDKALAEGTTYEQFRKELTPTLQRLGWWGKQEMVDPLTGELLTAQLGSPRRLKTIYQANMRTARAAGQYQRAQRTKEALPYFLYELGPSREHRPEHAAWAGTILPVDHPFWDTHFTPNGWGCKCRIRQITRMTAETKGGVSAAPQIEMRQWTNKRTGKTIDVPVGIDPGWDTNPGKSRMGYLQKNA